MTNPRTIVAEPGTQSIAFSREFEAPAAQVFKAHVDADLVAQWIGPKGTRLQCASSTRGPGAPGATSWSARPASGRSTARSTR